MSDIQQILIDAANRMKQQAGHTKPVEADDKQRRIDYLTKTLARLRARANDPNVDMSDEVLAMIPDMAAELATLTRQQGNATAGDQQARTAADALLQQYAGH